MFVYKAILQFDDYFISVIVGEQVISTVGRDSQAQDIVSAGTTPLVTAPLIV